MACVDWDHDGDVDLIQTARTAPQVRILRNESTSHDCSLTIQLQGKQCNRDAIGARVEVYRSGNKIPLCRTMRAGSGFLSQSSKRLHFGLGSAEIEKAVVRWPDGSSETFENLVKGFSYRIVQGENNPTRTDQNRETSLKPSQLELPKRDSNARIFCSAPVFLPQLPFTTHQGQTSTVALASGGKPILVCLWASWCPNCVGELEEFKSHHAQIRDAGFEILAVDVDGLNKCADGETATAAVSHLRETSFPFPSWFSVRPV